MDFIFRMPWLDRENLIKKVERLQNENLILQDKLDEKSKKDGEGHEDGKTEDIFKYEVMLKIERSLCTDYKYIYNCKRKFTNM